MINKKYIQNFKYIIWIHDSVEISLKLFKLAESLDSKKVLFVSLTKKTKMFFIENGYYCISLNEEIINKSKKGFKILENIDNVNPYFTEKLFYISKFKDHQFPKYLSFFYRKKNVQLNIIYGIWIEIFKGFGGKILILNGMSLPSFGMLLAGLKQKKQILFWENGLYSESIFIDPVGVNSYSNIALENFKRNNNVKLNNQLNLADFFSRKPINLLITLQVDNDVNIKGSSPFFSNYDFIKFLNYFFQNSMLVKNIKIREHPKYPISNFVLRKICKFKFSKSNKNFLQDLAECDILITINSTTGFESILNYKPVIFFGKSIYSNSFRRYSLFYLGKKIEFGFFDPNSKKELEKRKDLMKKVNESSLFMGEKIDEWNHKISKKFQESLIEKPFISKKTYNMKTFPFFNDQLSSMKYSHKINRCILILKKISLKFLKIFSD